MVKKMLPPVTPNFSSDPPQSLPKVPLWFVSITQRALDYASAFLPARWINVIEHALWFIFIGTVNTLLSYVIFLIFLLGFDVARGWALLAAYGLGMAISFFTFSKLVFTDSALSKSTLLRFFLGYIILYFANRGMLNGMVNHTPFSEAVSQFLLLPVVALLSYVVNRLMVFPQRDKSMP